MGLPPLFVGPVWSPEPKTDPIEQGAALFCRVGHRHVEGEARGSELKDFQGVVKLDVNDSVADWGP
jgi:hypothetical protein